MPNQVTVYAIPTAIRPNPNETKLTTVFARVTDSLTGALQSNVSVIFSTTTFNAVIASPNATTNASGVAETGVTFPVPAAGQTGQGIVPVTGTIADGSATVLLNFFSPDLSKVYVTNAFNNIITPEAINSGIQAIVYFPPAISIGTVINLHWGAHSVQHVYTGGALVWVIDILASFISSQVLSNGAYLIWYTLLDPFGNISGAEPIEVTVRNSPFSTPTLLRPLLPAGLYNTINLATATAGVSITIPGGQPDIVTGDRYRAYLVTSTYAGTRLNSVMFGIGIATPNVNITVPIPFNNLQGYNGVYGDIYYEIYNNAAGKLLTSFTTRAIIDTVA